jgi:16S rRNA G966 N2-methylase RsmD
MKYLSFTDHFDNSFYNSKQYKELSQKEKDKWIDSVYNFYKKQIPLFSYSKPDIFYLYSNLSNSQRFYVYSTFKNMEELKKHRLNSLVKFIKDTPIIEPSYISKYLKGRTLKFMNNILIIVDHDCSSNFIKINHISDFYILKIRLECSVFDGKTPSNAYKELYRELINDYFLTINSENRENLFIKKLDFKKYTDENMDDSINPIIFMNILLQKTKYCTLFKPYVFKNIVEIFKTVDCPEILDLSSGWGDRLIGAISLQHKIKSYVGIDPNSKLHPCYEKMIDDLCDKENRHKFIMIDGCSEKVNYKSLNKQFNIVFWSPPFAQQERYVQSENKENFDKQSIEMYKTYEEWEDLFLFKTLDKCLEVVASHGIIILYIGNINYSSFFTKMKVLMNKHKVNFLGNFSILGSKNRYFMTYYKL